MAALVLVSLVSSLVLAIPARSHAQQLRADVIAAEQAQKRRQRFGRGVIQQHREDRQALRVVVRPEIAV